MIKYIVVILLLCRCFSANSQYKADISIESDIYHYAKTVLAGKTPIEFEDFHHKACQRDVVEFILVQKAIALGGLTIQYNFIKGDYDSRNVRSLANGLLLISFDTLWQSQVEPFKDKVYVSDPVIRRGEFYAGIYTSVKNAGKFDIKGKADLKKLSFVSSKSWTVDWHTLELLEPKVLHNEANWISMAKLVSNGWVDAMLVPFTRTRPFYYSGNNYKIVAIDNIKVALDDSRHFVVSKNHPLGEKTFAALQKGLKVLRKQGFIEKAYHECGFINNEVESWPAIRINQKEAGASLIH